MSLGISGSLDLANFSFGIFRLRYLICVVGYVFARSHISPTLRGLEALEPKGGITGAAVSSRSVSPLSNSGRGVFKMLSLSIFAFCCQSVCQV